MKTTLLLMRHGETAWAKRKRYCGSNDIPLNAAGRKQAAMLGQKLGAARIDAAYCSDRGRADEFARIALTPRKIIRHPGLREMDFGAFEGMTHAQLEKKFPELYPSWLENFRKTTPPEGESFASFRARVIKAFRGIIARNRGRTCAIVSHGGVMMVLLSELLGNGNKIWEFLPSLASVSVIEINGREKKLVMFNDTSHLVPRR